jgi:hypothetical protein
MAQPHHLVWELLERSTSDIRRFFVPMAGFLVPMAVFCATGDGRSAVLEFELEAHGRISTDAILSPSSPKKRVRQWAIVCIRLPNLQEHTKKYGTYKKVCIEFHSSDLSWSSSASDLSVSKWIAKTKRKDRKACIRASRRGLRRLASSRH